MLKTVGGNPKSVNTPNAIVGHLYPFCLVPRDKNDLWDCTLDDINNSKYDYVKLHRLSVSFDIDSTWMHIGFDGSLFLPISKEFFPLEKALEKLNIFIGEILLGGIYLESLTLNDLDYAHLYDTGHARCVGYSNSHRANIRHQLKSLVPSPLIAIDLYEPRKLFYKDLKKARMVGQYILKHITNLSPIYAAHGIGAYVNKDWPSALINLWISIEQLISYLWDTQIVDSKKSQNAPTTGQREFLKNNRVWTVATKIEMLYQTNSIDEDVYAKISNSRNSRNSLIHKGDIPSSNDAKEAIDAFYSLLNSNVDKYNDEITQFHKYIIEKHITKTTDLDDETIPVEKLKGLWLGPLPPIPGEKEWGDKSFENIFELDEST